MKVKLNWLDWLYITSCSFAILGVLIAIIHDTTKDSNWISFWGSLIGAIATIIAVLLTIKLSERKDQNRLRADLLPYLYQIGLQMDVYRFQVKNLILAARIDPTYKLNYEKISERTYNVEDWTFVVWTHKQTLYSSDVLEKLLDQYKERIIPTILSFAKGFIECYEDACDTAQDVVQGDSINENAVIKLEFSAQELLKYQEYISDEFEKFIKGDFGDLRPRPMK